MKTLVTATLILIAAGALAQTADAQTADGQTPGPTADSNADATATGATDTTNGRERAPLALPDDLAPAVDVGGRTATTTAPAAPRAPAQPAAPASAGRATRAIDTLDLGTTSITGNQELPKVLYIVPWKRSDLGDLAGRPVNTLLDEVLAPIDPEVFERQLDYFDSLYGTTAKE